MEVSQRTILIASHWYFYILLLNHYSHYFCTFMCLENFVNINNIINEGFAQHKSTYEEFNNRFKTCTINYALSEAKKILLLCKKKLQ